MSQSKVFLEALFAGKPGDQYILIWTLADKRSYWFQKVDDASGFVESLGKRDVYVGTGLSVRDHGPTHRCPSDEIVGSVCVFADIDLRSDAHPSTMLPSTIADALSILPAEFPPSFVILTGNGIHAWWLFREPYICQSIEERESMAALAMRWNTLIRDNARLKGWKIERLGDLARVLRIPGTVNCKDPANPKPVVIHSQTDLRYNPSDLAEYLDDRGVADDDASEAAAQQWALFQDKPLQIDLNASIPQERLNLWMASDPRFRQTWFRQRPDLQDQSQSGYDMALANFGVRQGLDAQHIVDLIVFHRRLHKQKPRTTPDYFHRTLSKATQQAHRAEQAGPVSEPAPFGDTADADAGASIQFGSGRQPRSEREKVELCKNLSGAFGVELLRMVKVSGDQAFFQMELAEGRISFPNAGKLMSQAAVRMEIAGRVGVLIPTFKPPQWRGLVQMMLDACIVEDGGEELESGGAARLQITEYLAEIGLIPGIEGQSQQDLRKPIVLHDQIAVCSTDLQTYINRTKSQNLSIPAVVAMLRAAGGKVERLRGKKFKEQSRWMLPLEHFDPADYVSAVSGGIGD